MADDSKPKHWKVGRRYKSGNRVTLAGHTWRCVVNHLSRSIDVKYNGNGSIVGWNIADEFWEHEE